jgi:hypothetical protein
MLQVDEAKRTLLLREGAYAEDINANGESLGSGPVRVIGQSASLVGEFNNPIGVDMGANLTVEDIVVRLPANNSSARCDNNSTLRLFGVLIEDSPIHGVYATDCFFLTVENSMVRGSQHGGIVVENTAGFRIANSFVTDNGSPESIQAGVVASASAGEILFSTISNNQCMFATCGVRCLGDPNNPPVVAASSNIVTNVAGPEAVSGCAWSYSNIQNSTMPEGEANINVAPGFRDALGGDYSLAGGSPCIDAADPNATLAVDWEGDPRPTGDGYDMGADEFGPWP